MRALEVIQQLESLIQKHGNLQVHVYDMYDPNDLLETGKILVQPSRHGEENVFYIEAKGVAE